MGIRVAIREPGFTVPGTVEQAPLKGVNFSRDVSSGFVEIAQGRADHDDPAANVALRPAPPLPATMTAPSKVWDYRTLITNLAQRDLRSRYKKSVLGWLWSLINPAITLGIYTLVFGVFLKVEAPYTGNGQQQLVTSNAAKATISGVEAEWSWRLTKADRFQGNVSFLDAKYDEIQDADYFTILGLQRGAGTDEVRRAHARLSMEFDPIRFSTHPDAGVHQRAQVVHDFIEEAARALEDDRRRIEYARHLLD